MGILGGAVTFFVIWWTVLFIALPFGVKHYDVLEKGMMAGTPLKPDFKKILLRTTLMAIVVWLIIFCLSEFDIISFRRMAQTME
jgi:predicted secreted protein